MSQELTFKIPQLVDRVVMRKFAELQSMYGTDNVHAAAATIPQIATSPIKDGDGKYPEPWDTIYELNSALVEHYQWRIKALTVVYHRRGKEKSSPVYDEISIHFNQNAAMDLGERLRIVASAQKAFKAFDPERFATATGPGTQLAAYHESTLTRLEGVAEKVIEETASAYVQLETKYLSKRSELEDDFATAKEKLDAEHAERLSAFESREAALAARQALVDDRDNTHARRATRNAMLQDVKERISDFGVSSNTAKKRKDVTLGFSVLFVALCVLLTWSLTEANQLHQLRYITVASAKNTATIASPAIWDKADQYIVWARISLLSLGLLFSIVYYIKWQNRWAEQHANAEFQLQQFYVDVNRANWVVESGLEWHKETGSTIPDTIMQSLTTNLFRFGDDVPPALHPADELASALLGSASKLKLKVGENVLDFDKPGKIKEKS